MEFEKQVKHGLEKCGINLDARLSLGAAVSGGADSVAMLSALASLCKLHGSNLFVITVNHNIRDESETTGDVQFVKEICEKLSDEVAAKACKGAFEKKVDQQFKISCIVKDIPRGKVAETAKKRGCGIEEAARFLRYRLFDEFINECGLDFLCMAHTKDDRTETALMRFLQGSGNLGGMERARGVYARPLFDLTRKDVEQYLREKNISWREDSTNSDTNYLRNRIRHLLVPRLDEIYEGWRAGVISGAEKFADSNAALDFYAQKINIRRKTASAKFKKNADNINKENCQSMCDTQSGADETDACARGTCDEVCARRGTRDKADETRAVFLERKSFDDAPRAVRVRAVYNALNILAKNENDAEISKRRVPYSFVTAVADYEKNSKKNSAGFTAKIAEATGFEANVLEDSLCIKKIAEKATDTGFYVVIEKCGKYLLPHGKLKVEGTEKIVLTYFADSEIELTEVEFTENVAKENCFEIRAPKLKLPFCIRSREAGDEIISGNGNLRNVSDIFADWKVPVNLRNNIPVLQNLNNDLSIAALWGKIFGFDDWIVK